MAEDRLRPMSTEVSFLFSCCLFLPAKFAFLPCWWTSAGSGRGRCVPRRGRRRDAFWLFAHSVVGVSLQEQERVPGATVSPSP